MKNRLKYHRVSNGKTQTEAATACGVTQPTYQRWESGNVEVPEAALKKLAKFFKATGLELLGRHPPMEAAFYDDEAPEQLQYYGEVAVHFKSGNEPLVLSISEAAHQQANSQLQEDRRFITFEDLGNRSIAIRREAISEFYFSSEAYDWYGPEEEHRGYKLATLIQMPDSRDWEIVEALHHDVIGGGGDLNEFSKEDVERVERMISRDVEIPKPGKIPEGIDEAAFRQYEKRCAVLDGDVLALAHTVTIQLSSGKRREIKYVDCNLFEVWEQFGEDGMEREGLIRFPVEGYHRMVFLNPADLDYVSLPSHKIEEDRTDSYDDGLLDAPVQAKRAQIRRVK